MMMVLIRVMTRDIVLGEYCTSFFLWNLCCGCALIPCKFQKLVQYFGGCLFLSFSDGPYHTPQTSQHRYVAASSGSKDVLLVVDMSGSMGDHGYRRMTLAKEAAVSVLETLGENSYVNVIMFNNKVQTSCFGDTLVRATSSNIEKLKEWIESIKPALGTDFELAFTEAFKMLNRHHTKHGINCHTSILFLTDGEAPDPSHIIEAENNDDINVVIFSYSLGAEASVEVPKLSVHFSSRPLCFFFVFAG